MLRHASFVTSRPLLVPYILPSIYAVSYSPLPPAPLPSNFISYRLHALACFVTLRLPPAALYSKLLLYPLYVLSHTAICYQPPSPQILYLTLCMLSQASLCHRPPYPQILYFTLCMGGVGSHASCN
jgi:hypothetical protein